jgi:hypothetical protein
MNKRISALLGAVSGLALTAGQASAAPTPDISTIENPRSYSELLDPIPNALTILKASDAATESGAKAPSSPSSDPNVKLAYDHHHHHYHHHHHHHHYHHHHHHHHYHHHHHHHHHHYPHYQNY